MDTLDVHAAGSAEVLPRPPSASGCVKELSVAGWSVFVVSGDLTRDAALEVADPLFASDRPPFAVVDITSAGSLTAEGLGVLAGLDDLAHDRGGDFRLVVDAIPHLSAIRLAGFSGRFNLCRFVGDIVGAVDGIDEERRGKRGRRPGRKDS